MNSATRAAITAAAQFLATPTARKAEPYLESHYQLSLAILTVLSDGEPATCADIAAEIPRHPVWTTVNQVLLALRNGGIQLLTTHGTPESRAWQLPKGKVVWRRVGGEGLNFPI